MSDLKELKDEIVRFTQERDWDQFHNGKDLALALSIEASELNEAFLWKDAKDVNVDKVKEELGDLVFAVCNLARHLKVDAESAAELSTSKFSRRFRAVEAGAKAQGRSLKDMTLAEMDELWDAAKSEGL